MARPKKYKKKSEIISLSIDPFIAENLRERAKERRKSFSSFVNECLKLIAYNDLEYERMQMKYHQQQFYIHKARKELLESQDNEEEDLK